VVERFVEKIYYAAAIGVARGTKVATVPPKFLSYLVVLCFETRCSNQILLLA